MAPKIRIGIIGTRFGGYGLLPAFRRDPRAQVVAMAASDPATGAAVAARLGVERCLSWQDLVCDPAIDAIAVAVPPAHQPAIVRAALAAGKPVFAEKPLAVSVDEARALAEAAEQAGLPNMIDFMFRELDTWRQAHDLLGAGSLGQLRHVGVDWRFESYDNRNHMAGWKTAAQAGGGVLQHFGCHALHYLEWLLGPISALTCKLFTAADCGAQGDTYGVLALSFASGVTGSMTLSNASVGLMGHRIQVDGTEASLLLLNETTDPVVDFRLLIADRTQPGWRHLACETQPDRPAGVDSRVEPVSRLASRFLDWIADGSPAAPDFHDGLRVQKLLEIARRSAETGGSELAVPAPRSRTYRNSTERAPGGMVTAN